MVKLSSHYRKVKVAGMGMDGRNLVRGVDTWAVSLLRYLAAFVSWKKSEL